MKTYQIQAGQTKKIKLQKAGEYAVKLLGAGAQVEVVGRFSVGTSNSSPDQLSETFTVKLQIIHLAPHTKAQTSLRGVATGSGKLKLDGRIVVAPNCPDTNSFLEERVLLLSDQAKAEVIPDLEIESDDVKCSHAASISQIPPEQLFYLMSRGLTITQAQSLIIAGFLS